MTPRLKSSRAARDLIKAHEPFHGEAVRRGKRWVVGYGHTAAAKPGVSVSKDNAELLLIYDVLQAEIAVHATLGEDLPGPVRDALVSFAASVGLNAFKVSDVARLARAGKLEAAADALETWVRAEEDGRLVTSERLVKRRAAEKALMTSAAAPALLAGGEPASEAIPRAAEPSVTPAPAVAPGEAAAPEPAERGPLIDVEIAFEDPEDAAAAMAVDAPEPEPRPDPEPDPAPEPPAEPHTESRADPSPDPEAPAAAEADADAEAAAESEEPGSDAGSEASAVKASQDAAIQAVMARMAGEIAQSVSVAGVRRPDQAGGAATAPERRAAEPARDQTDLQLGYAFLAPSVVGLTIEAGAPQAEAPAGREPAAAEPDADAPENSSGEAAGPGRTIASPAPGPVYATVSVGPVEKPDAAPPHPAEAPAAAPGMSGESEGPDHPEDGDHEEAGEEEAELEPAIVAGPEAAYVNEDSPPGAVEGRGDWVHTANLVAGTGLTGLGAWQLGSNLDAYLAQGLSFNWLGPAAFAGGVLLLVSSGWVVVGKMTSKKKDQRPSA